MIKGSSTIKYNPVPYPGNIQKMMKFKIRWREFNPCHLQLSRWTTVNKTVQAESESILFEWFQSMKELSYWEDRTICELLSVEEIKEK